MEGKPQDRPLPEIAVRVFGMDAANRPFSRTASAFQVSDTVVRLQGIDVVLRAGDIIGVQAGSERARFRVTAIGPAGGNSGQVEAACLEAGHGTWAGFSNFATTTCRTAPDQSSSGSLAGCGSQVVVRVERRHFERYKCDLGAVIIAPDGKRLWARCSDISLGGCYLETWSPLPLGTTFHLELDSIPIVAAVSTCHPNVGMGVHFVDLAAPPQLLAVVEKLRESGT